MLCYEVASHFCEGLCVIHLLQLFWHSSSQCLWQFVSCFGRIYYFPRHRLIEAWETYRNLLETTTPLSRAERERDLSAVMEEKEQRSGDTLIERGFNLLEVSQGLNTKKSLSRDQRMKTSETDLIHNMPTQDCVSSLVLILCLVQVSVLTR